MQPGLQEKQKQIHRGWCGIGSARSLNICSREAHLMGPVCIRCLPAPITGGQGGGAAKHLPDTGLWGRKRQGLLRTEKWAPKTFNMMLSSIM